MQKSLEVVPIVPPPASQRVQRNAARTPAGEKKDRYSLPAANHSGSPVGFRTRVRMTKNEAKQVMPLFALEPPTTFETPDWVREQELFEEASLGILSSRQSTNFRGFKQATLGPEESVRVAEILRGLDGTEQVLDNAAYTHIVIDRPYRTPFTMLLTFIGHQPLASLMTVPKRAWDKRVHHADDIPTIGYLRHIHLGVLADGMERAAVIASAGKRAANVLVNPFCGEHRRANHGRLGELERIAGIDGEMKKRGWRVALVAQVGFVPRADRFKAKPATFRKIGANLMAFRSERIMPGVNMEPKAPAQYHQAQDMDVPDEVTVQCGRAAYNAFTRWTGCDRDNAKDLLLLERIDVRTDVGKRRIDGVRQMLGDITERIMATIPKWADLPTGKALSRNAARGKKAFALAGQRIYIGGLCMGALKAASIDEERAVRGFGAAAARSALYAELMGVVDLPKDCDMLSGICLMAGPVNQNDIGKSFYGYSDILADSFPARTPTSLLVWTLKAKTIADPIGNEEQLLNPKRKGALVDLRPAPHEVVSVRVDGATRAMRDNNGATNEERAFSDVDNFVVGVNGGEILGNRGMPWPEDARDAIVW